MKVLLVCNYKPGVGGISGQVEALQRHLREEGLQADIFSTKGSALKRLVLPLRLHKIISGYDVVHIHCCSGGGFLPAVLGINAAKRIGKRSILTYHGGGAEAFFSKHGNLVKKYLTRTDTNIVLSGFLGKVFDKYDIPYIIIPNIIELDESLYRERNAIQPSFICIRTHESIYNIPCILRAFKLVKEQIPEATLTLVGDGSLHDDLISQVAEMGLKDVTFTGRVDNSVIYRYLDKADIMLSSPVVDNMPVSLLEAMNAGLLVISSNVGGVPYIIEDGVTGLLFNSKDDQALAEKMLWAVNCQDESKRIIHNAKARINMYSWAEVKDKLLAILQ